MSEELVEGSSTFAVTAHIPVIESLDLSSELRSVLFKWRLCIQFHFEDMSSIPR